MTEEASFADLKKLCGTKDIGENIDTAIAGIAEANDLKNVIDRAYFNDTKKFGRGAKMLTTLTALITHFQPRGAELQPQSGGWRRHPGRCL